MATFIILIIIFIIIINISWRTFWRIEQCHEFHAETETHFSPAISHTWRNWLLQELNRCSLFAIRLQTPQMTNSLRHRNRVPNKVNITHGWQMNKQTFGAWPFVTSVHQWTIGSRAIKYAMCAHSKSHSGGVGGCRPHSAPHTRPWLCDGNCSLIYLFDMKESLGEKA